MTLFWHSQMGISNARVKSGRLMAAHVHLTPIRTWAAWWRPCFVPTCSSPPLPIANV
jgi:hypothetical protein